jgi:hypothetical protein
VARSNRGPSPEPVQGILEPGAQRRIVARQRLEGRAVRRRRHLVGAIDGERERLRRMAPAELPGPLAVAADERAEHRVVDRTGAAAEHAAEKAHREVMASLDLAP